MAESVDYIKQQELMEKNIAKAFAMPSKLLAGGNVLSFKEFEKRKDWFIKHILNPMFEKMQVRYTAIMTIKKQSWF